MLLGYMSLSIMQGVMCLCVYVLYSQVLYLENGNRYEATACTISKISCDTKNTLSVRCAKMTLFAWVAIYDLIDCCYDYKM